MIFVRFFRLLNCSSDFFAIQVHLFFIRLSFKHPSLVVITCLFFAWLFVNQNRKKMGGRIWRNKKDDGTKIKLNENKVMWFSFQALLGHPWTMMTETGKYKKWKYLLIGCVTSRFDYFKSKRHSKRILFLSKSDAGASIQKKCALRKLKNRNAMNTLNSKQIPIGMPQINKKFNWNV